MILCDNDSEYLSETKKSCAAKHGVQIPFIQPGRPHQNAYVERYNRTVQCDWPAHHLFDPWTKSRALPRADYGHTITTGQIRHLAA